MASVRTRLTAAYALALTASLIAFGATTYVARRASGYRQLAQRAAERAEIVAGILRAERDAIVIRSDSLVGPTVSGRVRRLLDVVPDLVIVLAADGRRLYSAEAVRQLSDHDAIVLSDAVASLGSPTEGLLLDLADDQLLLVARPALGAGDAARVVVGVWAGPSNSAQRELLGSMLAVAPLIILLSIGAAYVIAGTAVAPVNRIIDEVEAITDGRSLHRRLAVEPAGDEIARLGATLNAMLGRLENSFGALRRFTADASHELKTPLTVLRADVERAMSGRADSDEQLAALEEALAETTRMADLVDSLLTLARADEGRFDLHRDPISLEPLVHDVFETAVILGEDAGLSVSLSAVEPVTVMGDRTRLRQLFLNLVTNAIKYTPRGGAVELSLSRRDGTVAFAVRDTGIGIAAADLPYIFERFWRADRVRSRGGTRGGSGLGLAIGQWIAQAHGGTLAVQSRLGRGSTFTVTLPVAADAPVGDAARPAPERG